VAAHPSLPPDRFAQSKNIINIMFGWWQETDKKIAKTIASY
jgi:hypothetical protein